MFPPHLHVLESSVKLNLVVHPLHPHVVKVSIVYHGLELVLDLQGVLASEYELVEDVEGPLRWGLVGDAGLCGEGGGRKSEAMSGVRNQGARRIAEFEKMRAPRLTFSSM